MPPASSHRASNLDDAIARLARPGVSIGYRIITPGDENTLLPAEAEAFSSSVIKVRRQSAAARLVARALLAERGLPGAVLRRGPSRAPIWPAGIVGSLAHDSQVAIAAIASDRMLAGIGIDVEPAEPLPTGLAEMVATPSERRRYGRALSETRLLFAIKEAVYKACHPLDGVFLDFQDVDVDLPRLQAETRQGRRVEIAFVEWPRVVAVAYLPP
ncbi:MAG TPA: 4'-phosphopantetheinyl transferase superfamily protein [Rhodopila sp.]|uniref:4'-phosphopantetheinyl transferase family protein n=1 Tax=Rhodopila sp. TaxID=2480087 RepID=UPI002CEFFEB7|nr:4'-phosphopantetheinyl transferase superfamily protein [Rhodopila sp.]HVY14055.1 4'-phosphopantetheinyl transferase superfamily protein [Rhodopila sp.]